MKVPWKKQYTFDIIAVAKWSTLSFSSQSSLQLILIGREKGTRYFSQSQAVAMQNQNNCEITFDSQLKTTLKTAMHN